MTAPVDKGAYHTKKSSNLLWFDLLFFKLLLNILNTCVCLLLPYLNLPYLHPSDGMIFVLWRTEYAKCPACILGKYVIL